jgi:hypothetical protein
VAKENIMKKIQTASVIFLSFLIISGVSWLNAAENDGPKADLPVIVSSCGQSPGPALLKVLFMKMKLEHEPKAYEINPLATADDLIKMKEAGTPYKTLIIVMGASLKGMGAAGISIDDELVRTKKLIEEARNQSITLIGAHIEGMIRRSQGASAGDNTDELSIDAVAPASDFLIINKAGDEDGRFTTIANEKNIPMVSVEKNLELLEELKKIFTK